MKCPYCEGEMKLGYLSGGEQPVQWIPQGKKISIWRAGVADDAVVFGDGGFFKGYTADAYYCQGCRLVIMKK